MKGVVLAAGYATRLYPLTNDKPKGLLEIKGQKILERILNNVEKIKDIDEIIVVSNHKFYQQFSDWAKTYKTRFKLTVLDDGTTDNSNRLGAIGDIEFAIKTAKINGDLMVLVSDNYYTFELSDYYKFFVKRNADCILGTKFTDMEYIKGFAVAELDKNGKVLSMEEKPQAPKSNIGIYATYLYKKETLPLIEKYLKEGNSPDAPGNFPSWLHKIRPVYAYLFTGECYDIGTIDIYNKLNGIK